MTARRGAYGAIALAMLVGLGLRLATARGGLWLDEAWSARFVAQAGDPVGVIWRINHDNNHFLNSWWMLLVGPYAPPMLVRGLSIVTGVAGIAVAGAIGLRRSTAAGIIAAMLFAVAPILVAYGAEARGYAPMLLAMLVSILVVDRWLDSDRPGPRWTLGLLTMLGLLSQITYVFTLVALGGWIVVALARRMTVDAAVRTTLRTLAPSLTAVALLAAVVVAAAHASTTGFQVGDYAAFAGDAFAWAVSEAAIYTLGLSFGPPLATIAVVAIATAVMIWTLAPGDGRRALYALAVLAFPATLALTRLGNTSFPRYFLVACVVLLLLFAQTVGAMMARGRVWQIAAGSLVALVLVAGLWRDGALAAALRGDPARAILAMRAIHPAWTSVGVDTIRPTAVLDDAARRADYPLRIRLTCPAPAFVFMDLASQAVAPTTVDRCGVHYGRIAIGRHLALSGFDWALYARSPPQSGSVAVH
ncbi:hypothetical protein U1701_13665 [Sphingomonas sp. PB2P19]|uniref:hypothetical protein n=1 Tax=Sphingomonas rhamnosi TaxID=3096156 RepID=UPI002FCC573B